MKNKLDKYKWDLNTGNFILGITGSIGCGKTTLADFFHKHGALILNADTAALSLLEKGKPVYKKILKKIGKKALDKEGNINKKILAEKIFKNKSNRLWLENIMHPLILQEFKNKIEKAKNKLIVLDIALLFENNLDDWFHLTVCVSADKKTALKRALKRGMQKTDFERRLRSQLPLSKKINRADIVIENCGGLANLHKQANSLLRTVGVLQNRIVKKKLQI